MNILVYSGDGTSRTSLIHTVNSLRSLVGQYYDVMKIDATGLLTEPWEDSTSLLVIPGGRDLPFTRDLNGATNDRIRNYVQSGGRFFGICAGAYYGSDRISFELSRTLEIQGERELKFFAGECRGAVYPGFVYESESGANAVGIQLNQDVFSRTQQQQQQGQDAGLDFEETKIYFNGGGYFVDANKYPGTTVLAWYKKEPTQIEPDSPGLKAAMIACQVGQGLAVLTGVHPEYNSTHLDARNPEYGSQPNVNRLIKREHERRLFLRSVLAKMGLSVVPPEPVHTALAAVNGAITGVQLPPGVIQGVPSITPLFLASVQPSYTAELTRTLLGLANGQGQIQEVNDTFQVIPSLQHTIPVHNPITPATAPGLEQEEGEEKINKNIVLCADAPPPTTVTPEFDMAHFFQHLQLTRQQQLASNASSRFSNNLIFGNSLLYGQVVTSTQTMLDKNVGLCQKLPNGFVCNATIQVSGRGRGRNSWISPPGCLQFSMVLRHPVQAVHASAVFVQYLVALAVVESVCSLPGYEDLPLRLKWPNDIYAEAPLDHPSQAQAATTMPLPKMIKIGGVLVNSNFDGSEFLLVI
ncbi:biotin holocarboxylase synthetase, partial [Haplosporangium gracile]